VFLVIDKVTAQLGIFEPTAEFIQSGERKVAKAIEMYRKYFGENPKDDISNYFIHETL
jgi:hypothetical protein